MGSVGSASPPKPSSTLPLSRVLPMPSSAVRGGDAAGRPPPAASPAALEAQPSALPAALRATREYAEFAACRRAAAARMREVASVFANAIEGMAAQLTPARATCLVDEARRERAGARQGVFRVLGRKTILFFGRRAALKLPP